MPRWTPISLLAACLLTASTAAAQDAPPSRDDVMAIAADENIKLKMDKLTSAIEASQFDWTYADVYQIVDLGHGPDVTRPAAAKAGMFWDSPKAKSKIIADGRASAPAETVTISGNDDFVILFEFFNDIKYAIKAAEREADSIDPRQSHESDDDWFLRKRKAEEGRLATVSPLEGKINATTFKITLTGAVAEVGGCKKAAVNIPLEKIDFNLYRYTLGGSAVDLPLSLEGSNVESVAFKATGGRRFEAFSTCVSGSGANGARLELEMRRPFNSDAWTGKATFVDGKTGARL